MWPLPFIFYMETPVSNHKQLCDSSFTGTQVKGQICIEIQKERVPLQTPRLHKHRSNSLLYIGFIDQITFLFTRCHQILTNLLLNKHLFIGPCCMHHFMSVHNPRRKDRGNWASVWGFGLRRGGMMLAW